MSAFRNFGKVHEVRDGIIFADGLSDVAYYDRVEIETATQKKVQGIALNLEQNKTGIIVLGDYKEIHSGDTVYATNSQMSVNVSESLLGRVVTPLLAPLDNAGEIKKDGTDMPIERSAPKVIDRKDVDRPLQTGILSIDAMFPIGRGQRELVIGDRQTGKTAICIDTIINQKGKNVKCIYVAIGQKATKVLRIKEDLAKAGALDYTVIVAANSSDPTALQFLAPYVGCAIGEYFADKGEDALIIYDDLTKHAFAYRAISLLLRRPPGREAYPGDIFYLHSRLLERALQYSDKNKAGSLTALPVIETQAGDVSAYIPTNIISITDGQIFLETDLFNAGQKPAINIGISVSRVGSAAQIKAMKQVAGKLKLQLAQFRELESFAQFGSELDADTQAKLNKGRLMMDMLKQDQYAPYSVEAQVALLYFANSAKVEPMIVGLLQNRKVSQLREQFIKFVAQKGKKTLAEIVEKKVLSEEITQQLDKLVDEFLGEFDGFGKAA